MHIVVQIPVVNQSGVLSLLGPVNLIYTGRPSVDTWRMSLRPMPVLSWPTGQHLGRMLVLTAIFILIHPTPIHILFPMFCPTYQPCPQ